MVLQKAKSITQLKREIALQRKRIAKQQSISSIVQERNKLSAELFQLKNQQLIQAGKKARRLSGRLGRGLLKVGRKVAPVLQKQARLIRDQQLRDDALARRVTPKTISKPKRRKRSKKSKKKSRRKKR